MLGRSTATPMIRTFGLLGVLTLMLALLVPTAYGATLFSDDFEDGNASGWSASGGSWGIASDGSQVYRQSTVSGTSLSLAGSSWNDLVLEARVKPISFSGGSEYAAIIARAQSTSTYYYFSIRNANKVEIKRVVNGSQSVLQSVAFTVNTGTWYTLRFELAGSSLRGFVNGTQYVSVSDSSIAAGQVGLATFNGTASFDSVLVTGSGTGVTPTAAPPTNTPGGPTTTRTPTPAGPTATRTPTPAATATRTPTPPPTGSWPTPSGQQAVSASISVSGTFDGGMKRYYGTGPLGSGGQDEGQDPIFSLASGAVLKNVILGSPAADGIHCAGPCTLQNVWWEDVGEDAATFRGSSASNTYLVDGGGARKADDKVFQHNGAGTLTIRNFQAADFGKLYRSCGNCSTQYRRNVVIQNVTITAPVDIVAGINSNYGDTARFSGITIIGDSSVVICQKYIGNDDGDEPTKNGTGPDSTNCLYSSSDITYR